MEEIKMEEKIIQEIKKIERKIPLKSDLENQNLEYEKALLSFEIERLVGFRANISGEYKKQDYVAYNEILAAQERIKEIERINNRKGELTGVPSGFTALDRITNGWQNPDLIIIAARPSMGKTGLALSLGINAATFKRPVAFFPLKCLPAN